MVTEPVPVGLKLRLAFAGVKVTVSLALKVVNAPLLGVALPIGVELIDDADKEVNAPDCGLVLPTTIPLIAPTVAGFIVTVPVPVGLKLRLAFVGVNVTALLALKVVNAPLLAVALPIGVELILPPVIVEPTLRFPPIPAPPPTLRVPVVVEDDAITCDRYSWPASLRVNKFAE